MAILMNGKNVEHLIINGESFDKSYKGKNVEILNNIFSNSGITFDGNYQKANWNTVVPKGTKGYAVVLKYYENYYIAPKDNNSAGVWAQKSDIKILD